LMAAGVLAGMHQMNAALAIALAVGACMAADILWYEIGRTRGAKVLNLLCRISLEPDSCVRRTESLFAARGARSLLFAKFLPGLGTAAPPLAGMIGMKIRRFLLFDAAGAFFWAGGFIGLGFLFRKQLDLVAHYATRLGVGLFVMLVGSLAAYVGWKFLQRQRFLRKLRIARITPEELKAEIDRGEDVMIVDLRHSLDFETDPARIPGALHITSEEFDQRHQEIPRDRDIILYCT
jgi:membrane protein DedA with SNARE-associated domain